jgi:hypothetical protein
MCFPYHPNDPNLIPFSMTVKVVGNGIFISLFGAAFVCYLPMARAEPVQYPMVRAYPMYGGCDVSHLMNYPISWRCSEMIVSLIMMSLNSQMSTSCWMMILNFAEETS